MAAVKVRRNLHLTLIVFIAAIMLIGFLAKSLSDKESNTSPVETESKESTPDQSALLAEIRKQNEAALEADRKLRQREAELEAERRRMEEELLKKEKEEIKAAPAKKEMSEADLELMKTIAMSKVIGMRGDSTGLASILPGLPSSGSVQGTSVPSNALAGVDERMKAMLQAENPQQPQQASNEEWLAKQGSVNAPVAVYPSAAHKGKVIHEGTIIPAILLSKVNSDLPGLITARVQSNVYETGNSMRLAIPAGSRIVGKYNTGVEMGQKRVMAAFHRIILPDGRSINLKGAAGADAQGAGGLEADVDNHLWGMLGTQLLVATVAWFAEDQMTGSGTTVNISGGSQSSFGEILVKAADKAAAPYANRKPTLEVEPGAVFNILANQDIVLGE